MRDLETAEIGLRGAMTGHLVLSTLHTNDAVSSALRFMDMGAAGYSVAGSLKAVLAQRLVRKVCPKCVKAYTPTQLEMNFIEDALGIPVETQKQHEFKMGNNGRGCQFCNFSGYKGRVGVFEFLELSQKMMDALRREDHEAFSREALADEGYKPLSHMAYHYATKGITTLEEVIKVSEVIK